MKLTCLKQTVSSGGTHYPIYIGFASPEELSRFAIAPAFSESTGNADIASNVLTPPVNQWQRPLIGTSIQAIELTFNDTGRLMPNSVLLAKNPSFATDLVPVQQTVNGVTPTAVWEIEIPEPTSAGLKEVPLWILDGQHRIFGLSKSDQKSNQIPFVLLLNEEGIAYPESRLAEIFAQVTTTAASLDPLHNEWMSYSFNLGKYGENSQDYKANRSAMKTVALLCKNPTLDVQGTANPFRDRIKFNPRNSPPEFSKGFSYSCIDLQGLLFGSYFQATPKSGVSKLEPEQLYEQIGRAYLALKANVKAPQDKTVFFGSTGGHAERIMQDAFLVGVCTRLLTSQTPTDWDTFLKQLKFDKSDWNFKPWVRSMSGPAATQSTKIARSVFRDAFSSGSVPGQGTLVDHLRGNGAGFAIRVSALKENGRADASHAVEERDFKSGGKLGVSYTAGAKRKIEITSVSSNIGKLEVLDEGASTAANIIRYPQTMRASGLRLDPQADSIQNPLHLKFLMHLYGGQEETADLNLEW